LPSIENFGSSKKNLPAAWATVRAKLAETCEELSSLNPLAEGANSILLAADLTFGASKLPGKFEWLP